MFQGSKLRWSSPPSNIPSPTLINLCTSIHLHHVVSFNSFTKSLTPLDHFFSCNELDWGSPVQAFQRKRCFESSTEAALCQGPSQSSQWHQKTESIEILIV